MLEIVLVFGAVIFIGLFAVFIKLPVRQRAVLLGYPLALDMGTTALVLWMHWGTMTGLMSATVAGLMCVVTTTVARRLFGFIEKSVFHPGLLVKHL